jgi:hypothetical protein
MFIHRKHGSRWAGVEKAADEATADEDASTVLARMNKPSRSSDRPKYVWPVLPSSPFALDISVLQSIDTFNVFDYTEDQLVHFSLLLLQDLNLVGDFGLPLPKLQNFLVAVRHNYNNNSYHCYYHGFGVMHFSYWMLRKTDAGLFLPKLDQLSLMLASLCHDIDHPGTVRGHQHTRACIATRHSHDSSSHIASLACCLCCSCSDERFPDRFPE